MELGGTEGVEDGAAVGDNVGLNVGAFTRSPALWFEVMCVESLEIVVFVEMTVVESTTACSGATCPRC